MRPAPLTTLVISLAFSFCASLACAQKGDGYEAISSAQGLSQGLINDMLQDKEGFIWIATKGGLNRYDGYSFRIFTTDPQDSSSISSNSVSNLLEDSKGRLWASTYDGGLNVYNKKTGRFLRIAQASGLSSNRIESAMAELPDGRLLVSPQGGHLNIISLPDNGIPAISSLTLPDGRAAGWISKDDKGLIWISCSDNSIFVFDPLTSGFAVLYDGHRFSDLIQKTGKFISAKFSHVLGSMAIPAVRTVFIDSTGQLRANLVRSGNGSAFIMENHFPLPVGASGCNFYDFSAVKAGNSMNDVYGRNLKTDVSDQNIKCLLLDRSGVLWVGTMGHGIYKYRIRSDRFHPALPNMSVQRITVWNNSKLYVQGWRGAKLLNAGGEEQPNPTAAVIDNPVVVNVLQAANGDYWVYGRKKLLRYTSNMKLVAAYDNPVDGTPTEQLQPLIEDSRRRIWLCGANGTLARIDPVTGNLSRFVIDIVQYTGTTALTQTNAFYEDGQGVFWLGTEHGFAKLAFAGEASAPDVTWYKNTPGNSRSLSYNYVSWFMDDPADPGYLWVCTKGGGLNRLRKSTGEFIHYGTRQGLPNDVVYGILADSAGNIWGSTNRGLFCLPAATGKNDAPPVFRVYSTSDGLQADEFNTNAFARLPNGDLAFGGVNGINIFNPQKVLSGSYTPDTYITAIQIGNKEITPGDESGVLRETIEQTTTITLSYLQDVLTLEFSSLDYTAPGQNKYRYKLAGIDKEWVESGARRTATYLHLPPGTYSFGVQGSNSRGVWSNKTAMLGITVLPPWWRTWWAYGTYVVLLLLSVRAYLRFKVKKATLESQLNYEQLEAKRAKELDTAKTQLYTNITHEFRTPLTVILGMAQQVMEKPGEQFESRMDMIARNGRHLLNLVNQLLDLSKLESNKMTLQLTQGDVVHFLRYIVEAFHSLAESQQKQLHFLADMDTLYMEFDPEKLRQIIANLLSNAIKFTPEKGNIYISVLENSTGDQNGFSTLVIKVKDTGIGIPEDKLPYVFDRFYRLDNSHTRKTEGTGIGLALTKELVKLMNGDITVKSPPAGSVQGSEFTVSVPLKKVAPVAGDVEADPARRVTAAALSRPVPAVFSPGDEPQSGEAPLVLLVEDNADVVAYTVSCLPEYRIVVGRDGREGLEIAVATTPDLIISDVMMPLMDGFELVARLRENENTSHIPVIMLTAKADMASKLEGLQQGADAYLEKPFNKEELLVRIKKLLEMRAHLQQYYRRKAGIHEELPKEQVATPGKIGDSSIEDAFVKRVREAVEQNLTEPDFTVEKLCRLVFMSHSQLHRKLEALTGCSPNKFIRMIRLQKAKELLRSPANSIASVALDCGYQDPGYFARVFRQEYGLAPQEWRAANMP